MRTSRLCPSVAHQPSPSRCSNFPSLLAIQLWLRLLKRSTIRTSTGEGLLSLFCFCFSKFWNTCWSVFRLFLVFVGFKYQTFRFLKGGHLNPISSASCKWLWWLWTWPISCHRALKTEALERHNLSSLVAVLHALIDFIPILSMRGKYILKIFFTL